MTATTTPAARYYATRAEGRYRVIDGSIIDARQDGDAPGAAYVSTHSSRAKAEERAAKLNAEEPWGTPEVPPMGGDFTEEEAPLLSGADRVAAAVAPRPVPVGPAIVAAVSPAAAKGTSRTEDGAVVLASGLVEGSPEADAAEAAEAAAFEAKAAKPAKAEATTKAWRVGKLLREWVLAHPQDTDAVLVDHIATRNVCYDGTATLRLDAQWVEELSAAATALENAATGEGSTVEAGLRAPSVRAARASRTGLAKLFA